MADADTLWTAVKADYAASGLLSLTNIRDRSATTIDDTVGTSAAQAVINLWPLYAETTFDVNDAAHVEVAEQAVIAVLWRRGGAATNIEEIKWESVFGPDGMIARVRRTGARGHGEPSSNSGVSTSDETINGKTVRGWSDPASLPVGFLPDRRTSS